MAENKTTTLEQIKKMALRGKADSDAQIAELAGLMAAGLEDVQHSGIIVTLPVSKWDNRTQTVNHEYLVADGVYWYLVCGDADCFMECCETGVKADNITVNGQATFRCEVTPTVDLTINIIRLEVEV